LECQRFLGWYYYDKNEFDTALKWFTRATDQCDAEAAFGIGSICFVLRDFPQAIQYFQKAANWGNGRACHWLGYMYRNGLGVPSSDDKAIHWYERGAARGYLVAERALLHLMGLKGGFLARIRTFPRYISVIVRAAIIAARDQNDERIADIPSAFKSKVGRQTT
jgi:TPR repeat protein